MTTLKLFILNTYLPIAARTLKPRTVQETKRLLRAHVSPLLGHKDLAELDSADVEALHSRLADTPVQANRAHSALSAVLSLVVKRKLIPYNPCAGVQLNREIGKERFLSPAECAELGRVLETTAEPRAPFIRLLLLTGARPCELFAARWEYVSKGSIRLPDGKTGARTIYLSPAAEKVLDGLVRRPDGHCFPPGLDIRRGWDRIAGQAGLVGVRIYDLRHTFASAALASGASLAVIGQMLGHRKAQTTLRYAHLAADTAIEAASKAAERMGATAP